MNPLRARPAQLGRVFGAGPSQWTAASSAPRPGSQPWHLSQPFSSSARRLFSASKNPLSASRASSFNNPVPAPIPLVPNVATFLSIIGRNMKQHTSKFPSWEALFTLTSSQLRELGVEPPRDRRYLLQWLQRYREGRFGIGGDFQYVRNGVAELRVAETVDPENPVIVRKTVLNVPVPPEAKAASDGNGGEAAADAPAAGFANAGYDLDAPPVRVRGYKVRGARSICGPYALPLKQGEGSRVAVVDGMWEHKRGRKIDGGERRRAEVRFKRRAAERRAARESLGA